MLKKIMGTINVFLVGLLIACGQDYPEKVTNTAYQWEKARFDSDYERQQPLLYEKGSYEVDKTAKKTNSGLKEKDIRFEVYRDKDLNAYYVLTDFKNPLGANTVHDELLIRKKAEAWKVDMNASRNLSREKIRANFDQEACINCK